MLSSRSAAPLMSHLKVVKFLLISDLPIGVSLTAFSQTLSSVVSEYSLGAVVH